MRKEIGHRVDVVDITYIYLYHPRFGHFLMLLQMCCTELSPLTNLCLFKFLFI